MAGPTGWRSSDEDKQINILDEEFEEIDTHWRCVLLPRQAVLIDKADHSNDDLSSYDRSEVNDNNDGVEKVQRKGLTICPHDCDELKDGSVACCGVRRVTGKFSMNPQPRTMRHVQIRIEWTAWNCQSHVIAEEVDDFDGELLFPEVS